MSLRDTRSTARIRAAAGLIGLLATAGAGAAEPPPVLLVTERAALAKVEAAGNTLSERLGGPPGQANDGLAANPWYAAVADTVAADLAEVRAADPTSAVGLRTGHRLFDARWLRSHGARFELAGVVNRLDRRPFEPSACGEIRLIYRLAYATEANGVLAASRLPMTLSVVTWAKDPTGGADCQALARRWMAPPGLAGDTLGAWLTSPAGPLAPVLLARARLKSVEVNLQSVRWPSTIRPDMAGHAEYLLRVFRPGAGGQALAPSPLENTPDGTRIAKDPGLRADLVRWLRDGGNRAAIDAGTAVLPERFLALRATSVSPRGLARQANRPFRQLIDPALFDNLAVGAQRYVRSAAGLVRRLDEMSCAGCHQSRSVAGFHLLGVDGSSEEGGGGANAIAVAGSPHLMGDLARRARFVTALARGQAPDDARPLGERGDDGEGGYGSHCGAGAAPDATFARWTCNPGLTCVAGDEAADGADVGLCLPIAPSVGDPCQPGRVRPAADPHRDRVVTAGTTARGCRAGDVCQSNHAGFPGGLCAPSCTALAADGVCGGIPVLRSFNDCLAKKQPFERCIAENARPNGLRACDEATPCRDDYICARVAPGKGGCMPPYFLFQLRVDGHPALQP